MAKKKKRKKSKKSKVNIFRNQKFMIGDVEVTGNEILSLYVDVVDQMNPGLKQITELAVCTTKIGKKLAAGAIAAILAPELAPIIGVSATVAKGSLTKLMSDFIDVFCEVLKGR